MNHRPTDTALKNIILLALGKSEITAYRALAHCYQQIDNALKTYTELHQDLNSLIKNDPIGTLRDVNTREQRPHQYPSYRDDREERRGPITTKKTSSARPPMQSNPP
jgi:hypothetical protein